MTKWIAAAVAVGGLTLGVAAPAFANNPPGTGPPSQSCQSFSATTRPGHSYLSPGSPFNEPNGVNSVNGGNGGAHYSPKAQYDVACFQFAAHHP